MATHVRPMNVFVARGSSAERTARRRAGLPGRTPPEQRVIAPGIQPSPAHDLHFHGGRIIQNLTFTNFYVGYAAAWNQSDIQSIDAALAAAMSDQGLNNVMMQYFGDQLITSTSTASQVLAGPAPAVMSQGDVEQMVQQLYTQGTLGAADSSSTVFNFMLPSGTILNDNAAPSGGAAGEGQLRQQAGVSTSPVPQDEADSLHGLGGYHGSIHVADATGKDVILYYAVGVYSETRADGTTNGIPVFDAPWKNVVATFYHELNEARTDADVEDAIRAGNDPGATKYLGWTSDQGEEIGDYPVFEASPLTQVFQEVPLTDGSGKVPIQFMYSDAVHGPEGPIPNPDPVANL